MAPLEAALFGRDGCSGFGTLVGSPSKSGSLRSWPSRGGGLATRGGEGGSVMRYEICMVVHCQYRLSNYRLSTEYGVNVISLYVWLTSRFSSVSLGKEANVAGCSTLR